MQGWRCHRKKGHKVSIESPVQFAEESAEEVWCFEDFPCFPQDPVRALPWSKECREVRPG